MNIQNNILAVMIENDLKNIKGQVIISNHRVINPGMIHLCPDETVYITGIQVIATEDFSLDFYSDTDSREFNRDIGQPEIFNYDVVTRHKGTIHFEISNQDDFEVYYIRLKEIK